MARALTRTKLPLDDFARFFGLNPIHFNQCYIENLELNSICQKSWFQYDYQSTDRVSREQLARAIAQAEASIESYLGFRLLPTWELEEYHSFESQGRPIRPEYFNLSATDVRGRNAGVKLDWGYFITGGVQVKTLVDATATIVWSDEDGDGFDDTGTVTATVTAGQDACELELYYPGKNGADAWQIRPAEVVVAGPLATFTFKRELAVLEATLVKIDTRGVIFTDDTQFLTDVDVYRRYNDPQTQATTLWEAGMCGCLGDGCPSCSFNVQTACLRIRGDDRQSFAAISPAEWDVDTLSFSSLDPAVARQADAVKAWYRAGWQDKGQTCPVQTMDPDFVAAVSILAASYLDRKVCDCTGVEQGIARWQDDLAVNKGPNQVRNFKDSPKIYSCPFGTTAGAMEVWRRLQRPHGQKAPVGKAVLA